MWRNFFGKKAKIIGIDLNPESKRFEKYGFKIFIGDQIIRFFETVKWAMKLIFLVVLVELGLVVGVVATMGNELTDEDGKHIHHLLALAMTKSFALYSMEKAGENQKYLIENVTKK